MGILRTTITKRTLMSGATKLYPNIVHTQPIDSEQLVEYMSEHSQISKAVAWNAVYAFKNLVETFVMNGHSIKVPEIGTFSVSCRTKAVSTEKKANPKNCNPQFKIRFTPAKGIRTMTKSISFRTILDDEVEDPNATNTTQTNP